jgi:hypothetical protein
MSSKVEELAKLGPGPVAGGEAKGLTQRSQRKSAECAENRRQPESPGATPFEAQGKPARGAPEEMPKKKPEKGRRTRGLVLRCRWPI